MPLYHTPWIRIKIEGEDNPKTRLTEELLEFGPGGLNAPDVYLKRTATDKLELKAQYLDLLTDNILEIGSENKRVHKIFTTYLTLLTDGYMQIKTVAEANPKAKLDFQSLAFGLGGATAPDTWLKRVAANQFESSGDIIPSADNARTLGVGGATPKRWKEIHAVDIHVSNMLFNFHLVPDADNTYDLGEGTTPKRWRDLYLSGAIKALAGGVAVHLLPNVGNTYNLGASGNKWSNLYVNGVGDLGWLNVGGFTVITSARVLQNVTAATAIITSGKFPLARLPEGTSGYVLEAQGAGFDPMYVNPNGRYSPAGHNHAAGDITSGVLAEARCPNVYAGLITFNGGIVTNSVNCANWQATDIIFQNKFKITEAEKLGLSKGLAFLNPKGKVIMLLDEDGNIQISGKLKASVAG